MSKLTYWQKRFLQINLNLDKNDKAYIANMQKRYALLEKQIKKEVETFVSRYADVYGISKDEVYKIISKQEQKTWSMSLDEFKRKAKDGGYTDELDKEYFKSRINRLQHLESQLYQEFTEYANVEESHLKEHLMSQHQEAYLRNIYELTDRGSFSVGFDRFNMKALELAISNPWKGSNFSTRVWGNLTKKLPGKLSYVMSQSITNGWGTDKTVKEMMKNVRGIARERMVTLVQTESAHIAEVASEESMKQTGVKKTEWLATLEIHTCHHCAELDGQVFDIDDPNAPSCPLHPNCRCTKIPYIEGYESATRWSRDPVTGKGKIGKDQSFEEWKKENVTDDVKTELKKERNKSKDQKQYERYSSSIGRNNMPKSLEEYQKIKYNDGEEWTLLTDYRKSRSSNMISAFTTFEDYKIFKNRIQNEVVGLQTIDNIKIESQSKHFIERVFGTTQDPKTKRPRSGVEIEAITEALTKGNVRNSRSDNSVREYHGKQARVTVNILTGKLIQVNPLLQRRRKKA